MSHSKNDSHALNRPSPTTLDLLLSRRSGTAKAMEGPGPNPEQLRTLLEAASRAPDHGKLFPWRFIVLEGKGRRRAGEILASVMEEDEEKKKHVGQERERFERVPVVVIVVSRVTENIKIPEWEQVLSAGAVCQNLLLAAHAMGFVANWLTEWPAYDARVKEGLGLKPGERVAGFVYIGKSKITLEDRPRPVLDEIVSWF